MPTMLTRKELEQVVVGDVRDGPHERPAGEVNDAMRGPGACRGAQDVGTMHLLPP